MLPYALLGGETKVSGPRELLVQMNGRLVGGLADTHSVMVCDRFVGSGSTMVASIS